MLKITIWAQNTTMAGRRVMGHDDECTSDDHLHLEFKDSKEALSYAHQQAHSLKADGGYRLRLAATIREEVEFAA